MTCSPNAAWATSPILSFSSSCGNSPRTIWTLFLRSFDKPRYYQKQKTLLLRKDVALKTSLEIKDSVDEITRCKSKSNYSVGLPWITCFTTMINLDRKLGPYCKVSSRGGYCSVVSSIRSMIWAEGPRAIITVSWIACPEVFPIDCNINKFRWSIHIGPDYLNTS